eukprot:15613845-Heterocapsa_arctica.AAC.1
MECLVSVLCASLVPWCSRKPRLASKAKLKLSGFCPLAKLTVRISGFRSKLGKACATVGRPVSNLPEGVEEDTGLLPGI